MGDEEIVREDGNRNCVARGSMMRVDEVEARRENSEKRRNGKKKDGKMSHGENEGKNVMEKEKTEKKICNQINTVKGEKTRCR